MALIDAACMCDTGWYLLLFANCPISEGGIAALEDCAFCDAEACELGERPGRGRRASAIRNDVRIRNLARQLQNPPGRLDDAVMRYLRAVVYTFYNVFEEAVNEWTQVRNNFVIVPKLVSLDVVTIPLTNINKRCFLTLFDM